MAEIYTVGKAYWEVAKRFHENRSNPIMKPTALRDMHRLLCQCQSAAVRNRINGFIMIHRDKPPSGSPFGGGPRRA